jgi:hypothetical protein
MSNYDANILHLILNFDIVYSTESAITYMNIVKNETVKLVILAICIDNYLPIEDVTSDDILTVLNKFQSRAHKVYAFKLLSQIYQDDNYKLSTYFYELRLIAEYHNIIVSMRKYSFVKNINISWFDTLFYKRTTICMNIIKKYQDEINNIEKNLKPLPTAPDITDIDEDFDDKCIICFTNIKNVKLLCTCKYEYCFTCIEKMRTKQGISCPTCRQITNALLHPYQY